MSDLLVTDVVTGGASEGSDTSPGGRAQGSFAGTEGRGRPESHLMVDEPAWPVSRGGGEV